MCHRTLQSLHLSFVWAVTLAACGGPTDVAPSQPTQLAILDQPDGPTQGMAFPAAIRVEIRDANGVRVPNAQNSVALSLGTNQAGGSLSGQTTANAVGGLATFSGLTIDKAGEYTLVARSGTLSAATSAAFSVTLRFIVISPDAQHTCGVTASGTVFCWGFNYAGQLGDGTQTHRMLPTPVNAPSALQFSDVSVGLSSFTCARTSAGEAYCWGLGDSGQLGSGFALFRLSPGPVSPPVNSGVTAIAAGWDHACALLAGGAGFCWGSNADQQIGNGSVVTLHPLPTPVTQPAGVAFVSISAGAGTSCALDETGAGWCWGSNEVGALGDGTLTDRGIPTRVLTPQGVSFTVLETGGRHTCGLTDGGAIYCWGENDRGQLGDGSHTPRAAPAPVQAPPGVSFSRLTVALSHACAIATSGPTYCWGNNAGNMLGDGTGNHRVLPTAVLSPPGVSFVEISAGFSHTCALTAIGSAYCWGQNGFGELGDGTTQLSAVPVRVAR